MMPNPFLPKNESNALAVIGKGSSFPPRLFAGIGRGFRKNGATGLPFRQDKAPARILHSCCDLADFLGERIALTIQCLRVLSAGQTAENGSPRAFSAVHESG
jgi:hypothetical protein